LLTKTDRNGARRRLPFPCKSLTGKYPSREAGIDRRNVQGDDADQDRVHRRASIRVGVGLNYPRELRCIPELLQGDVVQIPSGDRDLLHL
jgi:hypothetical protein